MSGLERSSKSAPRICRSQADHPITGRLGSVQPIGQPIIHSEKLGLEIRSSGKDLSPRRKVTWSGREKPHARQPVGVAPKARINSQSSVQLLAAWSIPYCEPAWLGSSLNRRPAGPSSSSTRLPHCCLVGVGQ